MKNYASSIRQHLIIMVILYGGTWFILNNLVMRQQHKILQQYREQKKMIEYDYLRIKNYPDYMSTIQSTIDYAKNKLGQIFWVNNGYDPNLNFFQHIASIGEKSGVSILSLHPVENKNTGYFTWDVSLNGNFNNIMKFINEIEISPKFLRIESIEINNADTGITASIIISGIKKQEQ